MFIEKELVKAADFEARRTYANRQDYLAAIIRAVFEIDEEVWDDLSTDAMDWFNVGVRCLNNKKPIPDFDGTVEAKPEPEADPEDEEQLAATPEISFPPSPEKPAKAKKAGRPKKTEAPAPTKTVDEIELDKYGIAVGSKNQQAVAMLEKGCKMAQITDSIGGTYYNLLKRLEKHGHTIKHESSGVLRLIHADKRDK